MNKWLNTIKIIVLIILILVLLVLTFIKKPNKEGFQINKILKYFNIDYNYYSLEKNELSKVDVNPDELILDIGSGFGYVDAARIPWDSENRQLSEKEALWGVVPDVARGTLFRKSYIGNQLQDIEKLPYDDKMNKFHYDDPIFQYGTDSEELAKGLQAAGGIMTFIVPFALGMLSNDAEDSIRNFLEGKYRPKNKVPSKITSITLESKELALKTMTKQFKQSKFSDIFTDNGKVAFDPPKASPPPPPPPPVETVSAQEIADFNRRYENAVKMTDGKRIRTFLGAPPADVLTASQDIARIGVAGWLAGRRANAAAAKAAQIADALMTPAERAAKEAAASAEKAAQIAAEKIARETGQQVGEKVAKKTGMAIAKKAGKLFFKALMAGIALSMSLSWIPIIGPTIDWTYNFIFTPLLIAFTLPGGIITKLVDNIADVGGCCSVNSKSMDQVIPNGAEIVISFIPVWGDIFDLFYPYLCQTPSLGLALKGKYYNTPDYFNYIYLSCFYLPWPEYECSAGSVAMQGRYLTTQLQSSPGVYPTFDQAYRKITYYMTPKLPSGGRGPTIAYQDYEITYNYAAYGPYTNFNDVKNNPDRYIYTRKTLEGFNPVYKEFTIVPRGTKFTYIDFSDRQVLKQMAQFYYDFSSKNLFPADDGTINFSYISKINFVAASSLYTCDILCELTNISYKINDPTFIKETITFDHDRRFYFSCDQTVDSPDYWEHTSNTDWKTYEELYSTTLYRFERYINDPTLFTNIGITGPFIYTAYNVAERLKFRYETAVSNGADPIDILLHSNEYVNANKNLEDIIRATGATKGTSFINRSPAVIATAFTEQSNRIINYCEVMKHAKDQLLYWQQYYQPINDTYRYPGYKLYGCTHLDSTAPAAKEPDITLFEIDIRKEVNFNVNGNPDFTLNRCEDINISMRQCMDLSNVELIIDKYAEQFPDKQIKTIHKIAPKGKNACQFVWDEQPKTGGAMTRISYDILYQEDLSSCTFVLPEMLCTGNRAPRIDGANNIEIGSLNRSNNSNIQMYYDDNSVNEPIEYRKGNYYTISIGARNTLNFKKHDDKPGDPSAARTEDVIPRYDLIDGSRLPDLVRPKRPIRVVYPTSTENTLYNVESNYCHNNKTIDKFLLDYNSSNSTEKILKVVRAFTTSSNTCDMEIDVLSGSGNNRKIQRRTVSYNMAQEIPMYMYTVDSRVEAFQNENYRYTTVKNTHGLGVQPNTYYPSSKNSNAVSGLYSDSYLKQFLPSVTPNVVHFNDDLVTNFTNATKNILKEGSDILTKLIGEQLLYNDTTCRVKCTDPIIKQRIIEQYNLDNAELKRYGAKQNQMYTLFKSAPNDSNTCHLYFAQHENYYADRFATDLTSDNNFRQVNLPALYEVRMERVSGCSFAPVARQTYSNISSSALSLQTGPDVTNSSLWTLPARELCTNLDCTNSVLKNAAIADLHRQTSHRINSVTEVLKVNPDTCDYLVNFNYSKSGLTVPNQPGVLRVRYNYPIYNGTNSCGEFTYPTTPSSFDQNTFRSKSLELQTAGDRNFIANYLTYPHTSPLVKQILDP
jgi:hypothetical protein